MQSTPRDLNQPKNGQVVNVASPPSEPQLGESVSNEPVETKKGLKGSGLRYTEADGVPQWAIGKTADELLDMQMSVYDKVMTNASVYTPTPAVTQPYQPYTPQSQPQPGGGPPDPALSYTKPEEYNRQLSAWQQEQMQQTFAINAAPFLS